MTNSPSFLQQFMRESAKPDAAPERLALYIAGMVYPDINVEESLLILDKMARRAASLMIRYPPGLERAIQFLSVINQEFEFDGNRFNYYDVQNSFLNIVLERRVGLPITLSVICMAVGRRLPAHGIDIKVDGLGLPNHFMARYQDEGGAWLLDPFNGEVLLEEEVGDYLARIFYEDRWDGTEIALPPEVLLPVSPTMVAYRMLNNLRLVYLQQENLLTTLKVLDYMLVLKPRDEELWRERGLLHYQCENWERAARDIRRYLFLRGSLLVTLTHVPGEAESMNDLLNDLTEEDYNILNILSDVEKHRNRLN